MLAVQSQQNQQHSGMLAVQQQMLDRQQILAPPFPPGSHFNSAAFPGGFLSPSLHANNPGAGGAIHAFEPPSSLAALGSPNGQLPPSSPPLSDSQQPTDRTLQHGLGPRNDYETSALDPRTLLSDTDQFSEGQKRSRPSETSTDAGSTPFRPEKRLRSSMPSQAIDVQDGVPVAPTNDATVQSPDTNNEGAAPSAVGAPTDDAALQSPDTNNEGAAPSAIGFQGGSSPGALLQSPATTNEGGAPSPAGFQGGSSPGALLQSPATSNEGGAPSPAGFQGAAPTDAATLQSPNTNNASGASSPTGVQSGTHTVNATLQSHTTSNASVASPTGFQGGAPTDVQSPATSKEGVASPIGGQGGASTNELATLQRVDTRPRTPQRTPYNRPAPSPIAGQVMQVAEFLGEPSEENFNRALTLVKVQLDFQLKSLQLRDQHRRTFIAAAQAAAGEQQHNDIVEQKNEHHDEIVEQKNEHHREDAGQRREDAEQRQKLHDKEMQHKERELAEASASRSANLLCGLGTLFVLLALAMGANYHIQGFLNYPCSYLMRACPVSRLSWFSSWFSSTSHYAGCLLSGISLLLLVGVYMVVIASMPQEVKFAISAVTHIFALAKLLSGAANLMIGAALVFMIIPPGFIFAWYYIILFETLDAAQSADDMKHARLQFGKVVKRLVLFTSSVFVLFCSAFILFLR